MREQSPHTYTYGNTSIYNSTGAVSGSSANDIEGATREAVLREQEIETQTIIQGQREEGIVGVSHNDGTDVLAERSDPNALKEHLLRMTSEHRAEMALKRGKPTVPEQGNLEIGNGYGVPGGGAYYNVPTLYRDQDFSGPSHHYKLPQFLKHHKVLILIHLIVC